MKKRRLLWQLFPSYLFITLASVLAIGWLASHSLEQFYLDLVRSELIERARVVDGVLGDDFNSQASRERLKKLRAVEGDDIVTRLSLILPDGQIIADTDAALPLQNHGDRPEVVEALAGKLGSATRYSSTLEQGMMYVAIPAMREGKIAGVVRAAVPLTQIEAQMNTLRVQIITGGVGIAALMALASLFVSQRISRPLEEMRIAADRFARGELGYKMLVPNSAEMADLAVTLNQMSEQLEERIRTIVRQRNEQEAVLASMEEGVLAVDPQQRVISLNKAAAELLESDDAAIGRSLQEVIRNVDLRRFVGESLVANHPIESDIVLHGEPGRVLQAHGTSLRDATGRGIGAVIVLNDITNFRRLENIRKDFVANVSHELKTPITSIKGFVETLLDGAISDPNDAERFLRIIAKQADRLHAIIEDLLNLSKIEQCEDAGDIELQESSLHEVLEAAIYACQPQATDRNIDIRLMCDEHLTALINAPLLDQAVVNLLDNAVKYSEPGGHVDVSASAANGEVTISVIDTGCGIPADELPRIFERFYRVDKARSRKLGGTGLGLAIAKHIVNVHHGRVTVESTVGKGSAFSIKLPRYPH
jgi:two-component system phosphate regulon sensor histidine kinase PhoR